MNMVTVTHSMEGIRIYICKYDLYMMFAIITGDQDRRGQL